MRLLTIGLLTIVHFNGYAQGTIGSGLVNIKYQERTIIDFYKAPTEKNPYKRIEFFYDVATHAWTIENMENEMEWLKPEVFGLDESRLAVFRCSSKTTHWFELIVNNEKGTTLWVKQSPLTQFVTWEEYLKGMFVVSRMKEMMQKIRKSPNDTGEAFEYQGGDCFQVKQLKGDWIEIFTPDDCDIKFIKTKIESGWIRWKQGDKLLVDYYRAP